MELWIIYAFLAFLGYLFVNIGMKFVSVENPYLVSLILYFSAGIVMLIVLLQKFEFSIAPKSIAISAVMGLFSVGATVFALKAMKMTSNPGYVAAIFSANFVVLSIISVFIFGSSLSLKGIAGVIAVFVGLLLLSI